MMKQACPIGVPLMFAALLAWLAACTPAAPVPTPNPSPTVPVIVVTSTPTPTPTATPAPATALPRDAVWIAAQGVGARVAAIAPGRDPVRLNLPLNEGQRAAIPEAAPDGGMLAYLVENEDGTQRGLAAWDLTVPNARLAAVPLRGYRYIDFTFSSDSEALIAVQVQQDRSFPDAAWQVELVSPAGEEPIPLLTRLEMPDVPPPTIIAWTPPGPVLLHGGPGGAVIAYSVEAGARRTLLTDDAGIYAPSLTADGARLAYLTAPDADGLPTAAAIYDLRLRERTAVPLPEGYTAAGLSWDAAGDRLLLDLLAEDKQLWAVYEIGLTDTITPLDAGPGRAGLVSFAMWGDGVIYTTRGAAADPTVVDGPPALVRVPDVSAPGTVDVIPVAELFDTGDPVPVILYVGTTGG